MSRKVTHIYQYADTNGNGSGTTNAIGNYASGQKFFITPQNVGEIYIINRVIIFLEDDANFASGGYGGLATLGTGISVDLYWKNGAVVTSLSGGINVKNNSDWARLCYDVDYDSFPAGNNYLHARWTFAKSGHPLALEYGDEVRINMNDDLTGLVSHYFMFQGFIA